MVWKVDNSDADIRIGALVEFVETWPTHANSIKETRLLGLGLCSAAFSRYLALLRLAVRYECEKYILFYYQIVKIYF